MASRYKQLIVVLLLSILAAGVINRLVLRKLAHMHEEQVAHLPEVQPQSGLSASKPQQASPFNAPEQHAAAGTRQTDWQVRWARLIALPPSPERNAGLCALLEDLATHDPQQALFLARQEKDPDLRQEEFKAALEGWATVSVDEAGRWAHNQSEISVDVALSAVFDGARTKPDDAVRYAREQIVLHPERTADYGNWLIHGLGRADEHEKASHFAAAGSGEVAQAWLTAAYDQWAQQQPREALASAQNLADRVKQHSAFCAAVSGWARTDPKQLAQYANGLPPNADRNFALIVALRAWAQLEPDAAADFITRVGPLPGAETILED